MKDNLEKFILDNRHEFDINEPPAGLWEKIEKDIRPKKVINWRVVLSRAAAVVIIFIASYIVHDFISRHYNSERRAERQKSKELIIPELQEAEYYYSGLIDEKLKEIKPQLADNPSLEKEINYDLNQLDSVYNDLKKDLKDNIANQEVIEAMIQNYRLRLSILEDVLSALKPGSNENKTKNNGYDL